MSLELSPLLERYAERSPSALSTYKIRIEYQICN